MSYFIPRTLKIRDKVRHIYRLAIDLLRSCLYMKFNQFVPRKGKGQTFQKFRVFLSLELKQESDKVWHKVRKLNWIYFYIADKKLKNWNINYGYAFIHEH